MAAIGDQVYFIFTMSRSSVSVEGCNVEGVWKEWDQDTTCREVFREGGKILQPPACQDISTCIKYDYLLEPILLLMAVDQKRRLPPIEQLKDELDNLYKANKQGLELDHLEVGKKAWALKKLLGFVKNKARRREVSTATRPNLKIK